MEAKGRGIKVSLEVMNALKPELFSGVAQDCLLLKNTAHCTELSCSSLEDCPGNTLD